MGALHRNRSDPSARFFQLATVDHLAKPHNRTVVFRGFDPDSSHLQITTDSRSEKVIHIQSNPHAEICWYFSKTREQFRLTGTVSAIAEQSPTSSSAAIHHRRTAVWDAISDSGKLLWYWPHPKAHRQEGDVFADRLPPQANTPPDTFVLLLFAPTEVDYLQLRGTPQDRYIYRQSSTGWSAEAVNP